MKFLVTGGAGFIGSNFMHYEVKKYKEKKTLNLFMGILRIGNLLISYF